MCKRARRSTLSWQEFNEQGIFCCIHMMMMRDDRLVEKGKKEGIKGNSLTLLTLALPPSPEFPRF